MTYVHGDNLNSKISAKSINSKYGDPLSQKLLAEINEKYLIWRKENEKLKGPFLSPSDCDDEIIDCRTKLLNAYKDFIDQPRYGEHFDSRSNLHSSVLEEFVYYLFRDLINDFSEQALIGKSHAFKDVFFRPPNFKKMLSYPCAEIEKKDHDFVIGASVNATFQCKGANKNQQETFDLPAVAIECKTYLDKTMLESCSTAAEQLKERNPDSLYIVLAERLKLTNEINLKKYKVDQIYILRKEKNVDREYRYQPGWQGNPIYSDVVKHLYDLVRTHLTTDWDSTNESGIQRGYLL